VRIFRRLYLHVNSIEVITELLLCVVTICSNICPTTARHFGALTRTLSLRCGEEGPRIIVTARIMRLHMLTCCGMESMNTLELIFCQDDDISGYICLWIFVRVFVESVSTRVQRTDSMATTHMYFAQN
jgi:hypothetical protein